MFIWITLPEGCSSMDVFENALRENVAVLPGSPFYIDGAVRIPCDSTSPILLMRKL
jgi:DNA-binding transcriptional MocR family regulator